MTMKFPSLEDWLLRPHLPGAPPPICYLESICQNGTFCKWEIEERMKKFIAANLEYTDSGSLYICLKQLEYAVKVGVENLKEQAFEALGNELGGLTSGKFLGQDVSICYPQEWHYTKAVECLRERQKTELARLQDEEKASGAARQIPGKARLTITLRDR